MGVGQWTSLLMTHDFRTTPSKLDCALPTLHPKNSNVRGAIISVRVRVRVKSHSYGWGRIGIEVRVRARVTWVTWVTWVICFILTGQQEGQ